MKNYKVKATRNFKDLEENIERKLGTDTEVFMCTKERYEYLKSKNNAVELVEVYGIEKVEYSNLEDKEPKEVEVVVTNEIVEEQEEVEEKPRRKSSKK